MCFGLISNPGLHSIVINLIVTKSMCILITSLCIKETYLALSTRKRLLARSPTEPACIRCTSDFTRAQCRAVSMNSTKLVQVPSPIGITKNM